MGEPHAWRGWRALTWSLQIANVRQKETREIETMSRRGEDNPNEMRRNLDCGGHVGVMMMLALEIFSLSRILPQFVKIHVFSLHLFA
jgi:hypothetical protein